MAIVREQLTLHNIVPASQFPIHFSCCQTELNLLFSLAQGIFQGWIEQ